MTIYSLSEDKDSSGEACGIDAASDGALIKSIPCVCSRADAEKLVGLLNTLEVEPCHFEDIIEDYLTDFTI